MQVEIGTQDCLRIYYDPIMQNLDRLSAKEKQQGVWKEEKKQEEESYQYKRDVLCQRHICIMDPNHHILIWVVKHGEVVQQS